MNAYDLNDRLVCAVGNGMAAAADRFGQRMDEIRERRFEQKASETNRQIALANAAQVDELTAQLNTLKAHAQRQAADLQKANEELQKAKMIQEEAGSHIYLLTQTLHEREGALQRQCAISFALDELSKLTLREMRDVVDPEVVCLNSDKRAEFLDAARNKFMATINVKSKAPPIPPSFNPFYRMFAHASAIPSTPSK